MALLCSYELNLGNENSDNNIKGFNKWELYTYSLCLNI